jgi:esterase FrsA
MFVIAVAVILSPLRLAAQDRERTLEEVKQEILDRFQNGGAPMNRLMKLEEVKQVLSHMTSLDRDLWAREWSAVGEPYEKKADELVKAGKTKEALEAYAVAFAYYRAARYPVDNSPGKKEAYRKYVRVFLAQAKYFDPPLERVAIPFEGPRGKEIVGYLRLPKGVTKPPVVIHWGGTDSRKEDSRSAADGFLAAGWGSFATDIPGTGESPIFATVDGEKVFSRIIDYLQKRPDVDGTRLAVQGTSWGGYWAAKLAYVERERLRAAVNISGPVHNYFQPEWQRSSMYTREYLFDLFPARAALYGVTTLDEFLTAGTKFSLKTQGLLERPSAPLLNIGGKLDSQVPISDLYILMDSGTPKMAWVNPKGGHGGRGPSGVNIAQTVIIPWLRTYLSAPSAVRATDPQ